VTTDDKARSGRMRLSDRLAALEKADEVERPPVAQVPAARRRPDDKPKRTSTWDTRKKQVRDRVVQDLATKIGNLQGAALAEEVRAAVDRVIESEDIQVSPVERRKMVQELVQDTLGYGPLDPLLADGSITEVMCNAYDEIWVERAGKIEPVDVSFSDEAAYRQVIEKIVSAVGRRIDESSPMVDARLPDGSRVNAIVPPLAFRGPALTIRKFSADPYTVQDLIGFGTLTLPIAEVMEACVRGKLNIIVSGGTGTGKTTNLNVLSSFIPPNERIVTIEDSVELQLQQPHTVQLEARPPNAEGAGEVRIRDLVKNSLRMRPDRIVVGECRGPEALDMLQAMNTGHDGSLTTLHANSARDAISRLETLVLMAGYDLPLRAIREQIHSAIHLIYQLERLPDGRRIVKSLTEVQGMEGDVILLQDIFAWDFARDQLVATGLRPRFVDRLKAEGVEIPAAAFRPPRPEPVTAVATGTSRRRPKLDPETLATKRG
jgi:pilus assembly protein CpaF